MVKSQYKSFAQCTLQAAVLRNPYRGHSPSPYTNLILLGLGPRPYTARIFISGLHLTSYLMATLSSVKPTRTVYLELPTVILVQGSFQLSKVVDDLWPKDIVRFISSLHFAAIYKDSLPFTSLINNILTLCFGSPAGSNLQGACRGRHSPYGGTVRCEAITEELSYAKRQAQRLCVGTIYIYLYAAFSINFRRGS